MENELRNENFDSLCYAVYTKTLMKALSAFNSKENFASMNHATLHNPVVNNSVPKMIDDEMKILSFLGSCSIFN